MVSVKGLFPKMDDIALAAGAAVSGTVTGYVQQLLPVNLEFLPGMTEFLGGWAIGKFVLKKGIGKSFAKGIMIAGLSNMIASFIPQFAGTFPSGQTAETQVNGARQFLSGINRSYVHRNPITGGTATENVISPRGTTRLLSREPRIPMDRIPGHW